MTATPVTKARLTVFGLTLAALGLLVAIFYAPIWWVSLTAPNYPPEAFPDGVRIHFHMNGVFNGCRPVEKAEVAESEALDCVHEMDTINHYVGMYPIAAGGAVERAFGPFLMAMLGVMLVGFVVPAPRLRVIVTAAGFAAVAGWMALTFFSDNGLRYQSEGYLEALVTALDQDTGADSGNASAGSALLARLKAELAKSGVVVKGPEETQAPAAPLSEKGKMIRHLQATFAKDRQRPAALGEWNGSGAQMLLWHYEKSLGRYFNEPAKIAPMVATLKGAFYLVFVGILAAMALLVWGARRNGGPLYWLLVGVPMALPLFFLIDYSAWLWWYGHSLNAMGAFTVKPFMPTVFGQGKVAQFATHSYPYIGFFLMLATSALLGLAALLRRREWRRGGTD
ncbi:hypothetical protein [Endothiovibrio diazotrophicus]